MRAIIQRAANSINHRLLLALCVLPTPTFAASLESIINNGVRYLQGSLARAVGVAVIVGAGYLCLARQKFPKEYLLMIVVGFGFIFGASALYSTWVG